MYVWNVKKLADDLIARRLSQREKMKYFSVFMLLNSIMIESAPWLNQEANSLLAVSAVLNIAITIGGVILCYRANRQGDDAEFIERYICLGLPIGVRLLVFMTPVYLVGIVALEEVLNLRSENISLLDVAVWTFFNIYYYLWIRSCILRISTAAARASVFLGNSAPLAQTHLPKPVPPYHEGPLISGSSSNATVAATSEGES